MAIILLLTQALRNRRIVFLLLVLLILTVSLFCMSLNLYNNGVLNLRQVENNYTTIAVMELYGNVKSDGTLTDRNNEEVSNYRSVAVKAYDFSKVISSDCVLKYDLRSRCAAYIKGEPALNRDDWVMADQDIIRFNIVGNNPVRIPISWCDDYDTFNDVMIRLDVISSAAGCYQYQTINFSCDGINMGKTQEAIDHYAAQVKLLNRSDETEYVVLYPNVEYIAGTWMSSGWSKIESEESVYAGPQRFYPSYINYFYDDIRVGYGKNEYIAYVDGYQANQPFPVARWEDVQSNPILKEQWANAWDAMKYNTCAYNVCLTNDITGVPAFHLGGTSLATGRMITEEEYLSGEKVCMVSDKIATLQGWKVGDMLDMRFFSFEAYPNIDSYWMTNQPIYHKNTQGFFDAGKYEIVGIFTRKELAGNSGIAESTLTIAWNTIYIPHNAVQNTVPEEELPVHGALMTIWLKNGSINDFLADMDALGLTEPKDGRYNPMFTFYDQGYSVIQPSLQNMYSTAKLLLILSVLLLVITCMLLAYFFAQTQKHNIGIFRMLGGKKLQALVAVLACTMMITIIGAVLGAVIGHTLAEQVGEAMLNSDLAENEKTTALRAYVLAAEDEDIGSLSIRADRTVSVMAGLTALLFPLLNIVFVIGYIGKEPRELLPKNKA